MRYVKILVCTFLVILTVIGCSQSAKDEAYEAALIPALAPYNGPTKSDVDATTIKGKVLCGYQMWFSALGDGYKNKWGHWSFSGDKITVDKLAVDMWPDMTEYPESEKFPVAGMKLKDGSQAYLFSGKRPAVADLHFKWMKDYGIDGVFVQRFLSGCIEPNSILTSGTLANARNSANRYGRVFSITYDLTGTNEGDIYDMLVKDWKFLVDEMQITKDKRFLHENGKPVLEIYGFYPERFSGKTANKIIDFFRDNPKYDIYLICAGSGWWRNEKDPEWAKAYRRADMMKPWNVGNVMVQREGGPIMASIGTWADDVKEARKIGMEFMPCIYPGASRINSEGNDGIAETKGYSFPRRGGDFLWEQLVIATELKVDAIFIAMFDELDEGTAILKVTDNTPPGAPFVTCEGKPSDWYLRLVGYGTKMFRGEVPLQKTLPENP